MKLSSELIKYIKDQTSKGEEGVSVVKDSLSQVCIWLRGQPESTKRTYFELAKSQGVKG